MSSISSSRGLSRTRSAARRLALQALYEWQMNAQPWQDLYNQYAASEEMARADRDYFRELLERISADSAALDAVMKPFVDRAAALDPIEHAVLLIGVYELQSRADVPYRVVINEAVGLAKRFGATDGHKFVNAVLDGAAAQLRANER
jgi:N utilization substance protein B